MIDFQRRLGAVRSPYDERDHPLSAHYQPSKTLVLPDRARAAQRPYPSYSQDGGKCVAFSGAGNQNVEEDVVTRFNADEAYNVVVPGDPTGLKGTYIRLMADLRLNRGMYALDGPTAGKLHRIGSYSLLSISTMAEIELSIYMASAEGGRIGGAPWIAVGWPTNWWSVPSSGLLPRPVGSAGGHALDIIEYWRSHPCGEPCVKILNSWGDGYGDHGEAWIRYSDLKAILWEAWKTFHATNDPEVEMSLPFTVTGPGGGTGTLKLPDANLRIIRLKDSVMLVPAARVYQLGAAGTVVGYGGNPLSAAHLAFEANAGSFDAVAILDRNMDIAPAVNHVISLQEDGRTIFTQTV